MPHSKADMLEAMQTMIGKIMGTLIEEDVSIKPDHLNLPDDGDHFKMTFIREGFVWLNEIFDIQYLEVTRIRKMQPEEMWLRYKSWGGFEDHREVILYKRAISELRARIVSRARPNFFKKSKRHQKCNKTKAGLETSSVKGSA